MTGRAGRARATGIVGAYRFASRAAQLVPRRWAPGLASAIGTVAWVVARSKRELIRRHLARVDPTLRGRALRRATRASFRSYARYYIESFRLPKTSKQTVDQAMEIHGFEHVVDAYAKAKGTIFALPHLGGWEWAGRWMTDHGYPMTVVVEALEPPELFDWFVDLRNRFGMTVVSTGKEAGAAVMRALHANEIVCLLCDRDIEGNGVEVEMFGERTTLPAGPATLALRTGATVLPIGCFFGDGPDEHVCVVRPPLVVERSGDGLRADVARVTQTLADELAVLIRRQPEQWHMFQPNWPSDPGYRR